MIDPHHLVEAARFWIAHNTLAVLLLPCAASLLNFLRGVRR
jgi:hypothetical protein